MVAEEMIRKGPWTEHEDVQLVFSVNLFGDRRWDFIAKVSGLKRTGKSCRLRWVNYLHPGLKRGKMTPHEERLVLEFHNKWGNRWSRIARKIPGRTDNEIKNYWRTHMRKKAQEKKRAMSPSDSSISSSSNSSSSSNHSNDLHVDSMPITEATNERSFYDTGGLEMQQKQVANSKSGKNNSVKSSTIVKSQEEVSMDEIWKDIALLEEEGDTIKPVYDPYCYLTSTPIWDYSPDTLWMMMGTTNQEKSTTATATATVAATTNMFNYPMGEQFGASLTGSFGSLI